jgi:hypothetical protein
MGVNSDLAINNRHLVGDNRITSVYVKIAIENGHRNSGFSL